MFRVKLVFIIILAVVILVGSSQRASGQEEASVQKSTVTIDAGKTGEPISKYIYGQFIEHLGRCIYGGIWAEMLEDRKFYYPITDDFNPWGTATDEFWGAGPFKYLNASPWQVIGQPGTVTMVKEESFVGEHSPLIQPGSGIRQQGLGLIKDKQYVGYIYLKPQKQHTNVRISLHWGDKAEAQTSTNLVVVTRIYDKYTFDFTAGADTDNAKLEIEVIEGPCFVGTVSLMPADNINGWRKDVVVLLKELDSPIYRWPGGNFVSGYNWRDGIGERDKRPPRKNPAWKGVEHNDVGIHEYMELMELINAEPFIAVNTGLGTVEEVAQEVEYCNGSADTPMGKLRAQNGHPEPFNVKWWAVGNEMYGSWQLGHMPLEEYVKKHNRVAEAMWNVDKSIKLIGVGKVGQWSETMLEVCSDQMDLISEHIYCKEEKDVIEHTKQLSGQISLKANAHRKYREDIEGLADKDIRIAMDEWNFWYGDYIYGELGVQYHHKDALGVAIGLHEFFRNSDLYFMANYAQTVNVIGCIKASKTAAAFETTGLVLKLYGNNYGTIPVAVAGDIAPLDVTAAWTEDRKALTIGAVNPTGQAQQITMDIKDTQLAGTGKLGLIAHPDPMAHNKPGKEPNVVIEEKSITGISNTLNLPPLSVSLYRLGIKD